MKGGAQASGRRAYATDCLYLDVSRMIFPQMAQRPFLYAQAEGRNGKVRGEIGEKSESRRARVS